MTPKDLLAISNDNQYKIEEANKASRTAALIEQMDRERRLEAQRKEVIDAIDKLIPLEAIKGHYRLCIPERIVQTCTDMWQYVCKHYQNKGFFVKTSTYSTGEIYWDRGPDYQGV